MTCKKIIYWCFWIQWHIDVKKYHSTAVKTAFSRTTFPIMNCTWSWKCGRWRGCKEPRLLHSRKKIKDDLSGAKRMMDKVSYMCGALLSEFMVNGRDRDERFLDTVFVRANISCIKNRAALLFGCLHTPPGMHLLWHWRHAPDPPKCINCHDQPNVPRRKRKTVVQDDFNNKKKKKSNVL